MKVILDTCFLLAPFQLKIDIISEIERILNEKYQLIVFDKTLDELENIIKKQKGKDVEAAKFALEILRKENIKIISSKTETLKNVDELIVEEADQKGYIVATQDRELKSRLRQKKIKIIEIRQKNYLKIG